MVSVIVEVVMDADIKNFIINNGLRIRSSIFLALYMHIHKNNTNNAFHSCLLFVDGCF